jgi:Flp pilus assembly protein CpaB
MVVAIVCGLTAAYATSQVISNKQENTEETVQYLVAKKKIDMGTLVKTPEELFDIKTVKKGDEPKNALTKFEDVKDHRLNRQLSIDYHVTPDDLFDKNSDTMAVNITPGMRAFGIKTSAETSVGGFVLPHSHVDIIAIIRGKDNKSIAKTLWQNVLVLAVDATDRRPDDKTSIVASVVTVEVTPTQAEEMTAITEQGAQLRLSLRGYSDEEKVQSAGVKAEDLTSRTGSRPEDLVRSDDDSTGKPKAPAWVPQIPDVPVNPQPAVIVKEEPKPEAPFVMTIYNADQVTKYSYPKDGPVQVEKSATEREPRRPAANGSVK